MRSVKEWMTALKTTGAYSVDEDVKTKITSLFAAGFCDDAKTKTTIDEFFNKYGYLCDTHTAVAVNVYKEYVEKTGDRTPVVLDSTASPYKFSGSVLKAIADGEELPNDEFEMVDLLSKKTGTDVPKPLAALKDKETRFTEVVNADEMPEFVLNALGVK